MPMPESMSAYQETNPNLKKNCDVTVEFSPGQNLLVELYYLDIRPIKDGSGICRTGLEVRDQSMKNIYGKRLCMEAWEWEEQHALNKQEKRIVRRSPLIFRLVSEGPYEGNGFKVHFNQFRPQYPCSNREFKCVELTRCIHEDLTCDGWDDCGDHSDEEREAGCDLLTESEICAVVMGCLFFLGQVIITVLFCFTYRRLRKDYGLRSESKIPLGMDPALFKRYNSQESMGTHYSRTTGGGRTRRDSDSSVDKLDLEKLDRLTMDNASERSYRSNAKSKARSLALGSEAGSEIPRKTGQYSYNGGRRGRVASSNSINKGEAPLKINGIDNPVVGQDSPRDSVERNGGRITPDRKSTGSRRRNRGRDDYSDYSDDDDDDRRRRRRSRDRRSQRLSDDYDSESDYERDRRRRRRRRRSYSDDDYDSYDSEYERERRRRRRSKERQRRSRELDGENQDKNGQGTNEGEEEPRRHRGSRDRDRNRDSYDSEEEDARKRRRRRSPSQDNYDDDSRDRRRRRRSKSYDDDDYDDRDRRRRRSPSYDDEDDDRERRRRSKDRSRGQSRERNRRPPGSDRDETDAPRDAERMSRALAKEVESKVPRHEADPESPRPPLPSSFRPSTPKEETPLPPSKPKEDTPTPPPSQKRALTPPPARDPSPPPAVSVKQPSNHSYHPPAPQAKHQRLPPVAPPPSGEEIRRMEEERERRKQHLHQQRIQRHQQVPSPPSSTSAAPVSPNDDSRERRRSQDNRRERYSRDRFRQKGRRSDPEPPTTPTDYEDVYPRVRLDAPLAGYREETV
ncbi:hypothetical protein ElyMa_005412100 [Elysia marginata]|uniref:CUB domain-containing protein n=1 Tax=Elysia marginata TaxID=1093978 RepID=A0AAV4EIG8_9GAST|nr:hypothetical protein ElyMa_005412100 [Elysia marginata]